MGKTQQAFPKVKCPLHTYKSEIHDSILILEMPSFFFFSFPVMPPWMSWEKEGNYKIFH
jgi:hypothetical protein